jgi:hypothetical protein
MTLPQNIFGLCVLKHARAGGGKEVDGLKCSNF